MDTIPSMECDHYYCIYLEKVEGKCCEECGGKISISDGAFACEECGVCLYRSCAIKTRRILSHEITYPLHLQHRLELEWCYWDFICDKCLYISIGYRYRCNACDFSLDFDCAFTDNEELPKDQEQMRFKDGKKKTIQHYSHGHELSFFKYKKMGKEDLDCFWYEKHLSEVCYSCLKEECKFYLHQACNNKIRRTLSHPFHPGHPLRLSYVDGSCNACKKCIIDTYSPRYMCEMCSFHLHIDCAKRFPTLKLVCHPHLLTYLTDYGDEFRCDSCNKHCGGAIICRCMQCPISFHLKCVVPSEAKQKYHRHPLILTESMKEDDSDEFYCDVCENEREPKHPVYYCQSCKYIAHI